MRPVRRAAQPTLSGGCAPGLSQLEQPRPPPPGKKFVQRSSTHLAVGRCHRSAADEVSSAAGWRSVERSVVSGGIPNRTFMSERAYAPAGIPGHRVIMGAPPSAGVVKLADARDSKS